MNRRETLAAITIAVVITAVLLFAAKAKASQGFSFSDPAFIRMLQRSAPAAPTTTNHPLIDFLVGYYRLDTNTWLDAHTNSLTLTENNGPIMNTNGLITNAVRFLPGSKTLTQDNDLFRRTNNQPFTIAFAANWVSLPDCTLVAMRDADGVNATWGFDKSGTTFRFYLCQSDGGFDILSSSTSAQLRLSNVWHTFILVCDGTNFTMRVDLTNYVSATKTEPFGVGDPYLCLGAQRVGAGFYTNRLDGFAFWRTNLSLALQTNLHNMMTNGIEYPWGSFYP